MSNVGLTPGVFIPEPKQTDLRNEAVRARLAAASQQRADTSTQATPSDTRTAHDTVTLSGTAEKMVNLNRGLELAAEFKNAPPTTISPRV